jgi:hypothetical protein
MTKGADDEKSTTKGCQESAGSDAAAIGYNGYEFRSTGYTVAGTGYRILSR